MIVNFRRMTGVGSAANAGLGTSLVKSIEGTNVLQADVRTIFAGV